MYFISKRFVKVNLPYFLAVHVDTASEWAILGGTPCKSDGDVSRKTKIKPLRQTNVSVAQA